MYNCINAHKCVLDGTCAENNCANEFACFRNCYWATFGNNPCFNFGTCNSNNNQTSSAFGHSAVWPLVSLVATAALL